MHLVQVGICESNTRHQVYSAQKKKKKTPSWRSCPGSWRVQHQAEREHLAPPAFIWCEISDFMEWKYLGKCPGQ